MTRQKSIDKKTQPKKGISRRDFIKSTAVAGVAASVGPWFIKDALSSSGKLKLFTWSDYSEPEVIQRLKKPPASRSRSPTTAPTRNV